MATVAIYCRVSTKDQKDQGCSLETQRDEGLSRASALGLEAPDAFIIMEDWTGTDLERPGILKLLGWARAGSIQAVIIYTLDRLCRPEEDGDEWRVFPLLQQFHDLSVDIIWVDHTMPSGGPFANMWTMFRSWCAGQERRAILERTTRGRLARAREGAILGGFVPYGYNYVPKHGTQPGHYEVNEGQAVYVRRTFSWLLELGLSCDAIAKRLTDEGIPTPRGKQVWHGSVINHMVRQELYCGVAYFRKYESAVPKRRRTSPGGKTSRKWRPKDQWVPIAVPPIIERSTWEAAQRQLLLNAKFSPRNNKRRRYLLSGVLESPSGKPYFGCGTVSRGHEYRYYCCNGNDSATGQAWREPNVNAGVIERVVCDAIAGVLSDRETLRAEFERRRQETQCPDRIEAEGQRLVKELAAIKQKQDRFLDLYGDSRISRETLDSKLDDTRRRELSVQTRLKTLERESQSGVNAPGALDKLEAFCDTVAAGVANLSFEEWP